MTLYTWNEMWETPFLYEVPYTVSTGLHVHTISLEVAKWRGFTKCRGRLGNIKLQGKVIPLQAQCGGRGIALLFHDRGTRRRWAVSSTPRPHFTPGRDPIPIWQEAGWAPGPVWTGGKSRPHRDSIPDRPARSQSLYRLSYRAHRLGNLYLKIIRESSG